MQNVLVHVACHPRRKHLMYVRGKINLSERESYSRAKCQFTRNTIMYALHLLNLQVQARAGGHQYLSGMLLRKWACAT
jgi:hypothetical protein